MRDVPTPPDGTIDTHVHMNPFWRLHDEARATLEEHSADFQRKVNLARDPDEFVAYLDSQGIAMAAIINYVSSLMGYTHDTNDWAAAYREAHPDRILAFGGFDPHVSEDPAATVDHALNNLDLDGIKIHPPHQEIKVNDYRDDPDTRELDGLRLLYERCEEAGVPVMIHTGTSIFTGARSRYADPMPIDDVAVDFPDLPIIMAHGGRPLYTDEASFLLYRHENVYLDISSFPPQNLLEYFPEIEGFADRVMFGSDWPGPMVPDIGANVDVIRDLDLPQSVIELILRGTAERLYDL